GYFHTFYYYHASYMSDSRVKENVRSLNSPLEKLKNIRGVKYDYITPSNPKWSEEKINEMEYMDNDNIGFIAQELMEVYPELVKYDKNSDLYGINMNGMIPILVEAIKEQQTMIDTLTAKIEYLSPKVSNLKSELTSTTEIIGVENYLSQNKPNPFNQETEIEYYITSWIQNAALYIYDMQGTQIKSYDIQERGLSSISIHGSEFSPGMYLYTLIVDGNEVDTKRMILTD
ncbi:tail fiber domain-containing protein, partial [Bacteroidota bacterium]